MEKNPNCRIEFHPPFWKMINEPPHNLIKDHKYFWLISFDKNLHFLKKSVNFSTKKNFTAVLSQNNIKQN